MHVNIRHRQSQKSTIQPNKWTGGSKNGVFLSKPILVNTAVNPQTRKPIFTGHII